MTGSMSIAAWIAWRSFWLVMRPSFLLKTAIAQAYGRTINGLSLGFSLTFP